MVNRLVILLILAASREISAASCRFWLSTDGYSCDLYNVDVQMESEVLVITGEHLSGYDNSRVECVNILNLTMSFLHKSLFDTFPNVQQLSISRVAMLMILDDAFGACSRLRILDVAPNPITTLQAGVLANCHELTAIYFRDANLRTISPEAFRGLGNLRSIVLSDNVIGSLDANIFDHNANLTNLNLSGNKMSRVEPLIFKNLVNLRFLDVDGNSIEEIGATMFESLRSLVSLNLKNCGIRKIHSEAFKNLESLSTLYLDNNGIETIEPGTFSSLLNLRALYLNQNRIKRLNKNAFASSHPIANFIFEINSNELDEVEEGFFEAFPRLMHVDALKNVCIDKLVRFVSDLPAEFEKCYQNWVSPRPTTGSTDSSGSTTESTTQGAATTKLSTILIVKFYIFDKN